MIRFWLAPEASIRRWARGPAIQQVELPGFSPFIVNDAALIDDKQDIWLLAITTTRNTAGLARLIADSEGLRYGGLMTYPSSARAARS